MQRREWLTATGAIAVAAAGSAGAQVFGANAPKKKVKEPAHAHGSACCSECAACAVECAGCAGHCAAKLAEGETAHAATMAICNDCSDLCSISATIGARGGPLAALVCGACAQACDKCADACEKFEDDEQMTACAKRCRDCAAACREMKKELEG
ncbi:MAG TPA: four-helix bundle copper-binding protein [Pirellulales bacterium]|jgi:hypothetical protein|nr:four-helix bundle copper-binding protein [Pirellulales bacterium]